jgi:hypothetical protein
MHLAFPLSRVHTGTASQPSQTQTGSRGNWVMTLTASTIDRTGGERTNPRSFEMYEWPCLCMCMCRASATIVRFTSTRLRPVLYIPHYAHRCNCTYLPLYLPDALGSRTYSHAAREGCAPRQSRRDATAPYAVHSVHSSCEWKDGVTKRAGGRAGGRQSVNHQRAGI